MPFGIRNPFSRGAPPVQQQQPAGPQANQPPTDAPLPDTRVVGGPLDKLRALRHHLPGASVPAQGAQGAQGQAQNRPMPQGSPLNDLTGGGANRAYTPFHARTTVRASRPAPEIALGPGQTRTPKANASTPLGVNSQHRANVKTSVGENERAEPQAHAELRNVADADEHLRASFPAETGTQFATDRDALLNDIREAIPQAQRGNPPLAKARFLGHALAEATGGNVQRASDVLGVLQGTIPHPNAQQERDAFATRCAMARSRASFRALRDVETAPQMGGAIHGPTDRDRKVHAEADWQTLRAASTLLSAWPAGMEKPGSLRELSEAANAMLPPAERDPNTQVAQSQQQAAISLALAPHAQTAKAMLCGNALLGSPRAQPETRFRSAYLAHRNGIAEADVGQVQNRMYSLVKHAQRNATSARTGSWMNRTAQRFRSGVKQSFGHDKDPISALGMGTAGGLMDHPNKDFSTLQSIDAVVDVLNTQVVSAPHRRVGEAPDNATMTAAVRAAALRQWKAGIGTKGWLRDDTKFGRLQRNQIAGDVATALRIDKDAVRNSPAFRDLPKMNAETLRNWATDAGATMNTPIGSTGRTLRENLDRMQAIRQDPVATPATPQGNIDSLCHLVENVPKTWSVQMSSGGVYGLDANISENIATALGLVGAPGASVAPDVRYLKGRHAVLEVGSTSHHGEMFIGTDNRKSAHIGVGGFIGWSLAGGKAMASGYGSLIGGRDTSNPRGVVIRTPFAQTGNNDPEAWRGKMTDVVRTLGSSGTGGQLPRTKDEMWNGMADRFFADPDVSIGWVDNKSSSNYGALAATGGARYVTPANVKFGPLVTVEGVFSKSKAHATDQSGARNVDKSSSSHRAALNGSATLVASAPPVPTGNFGPFNSLSFSSAPMVGIGTTLMQTGTGSTLRLYEENGDIVPERTYRDTEFTSVGNYLQYIDSRNAAWAHSMNDDQAALDTYQSKVKLNATRGNQYYGERQRIVPQAAAEINAYRGTLRMFEQGGRTPTQDEQKEMLRIRGEIASLLEAPTSWTNHALYSYESNSASRTSGLSYVGTAQAVKQVSAQRELSLLETRV
ncbi:hypothetical protein B0G76_6502 [Paraburkholderia sp. BL23I1N1]|uniref:hypothetical protein n=1 Tax=Paraburkholderia sp. BL23I1N1 TaxID=1938802 RepID=UPI000E74ADAF|nr:hypothetical protein [Paraburkholderia sp. BL23I1N1]RKE40041.1 hypothetical protein B0G76_6502 [Paraburkholderia sp. BL23I1N1]